MQFWIIAAGMALVVAALMVLAMLRRAGAAEGSAGYDVQVYRDQLKEVERDLARGVLSEAEAEQVRLEVSRRLLEADRAAQAEGRGAEAGAAVGGAPRGLTLAVAGLVLAAVAAGSLALYQRLGAPGYPDLPLAERIAMAEEARRTRPSQADAEASLAPLPDLPDPAADPQFLELMARLRQVVEERPGDLQGHALLARNEARLGRFAAAHAAQRRVIEIKGEAAAAEDWSRYADLLVLAAGGYVSPEAEEAVSRTLALDPGNGTARYYSGLLAAQTGRPDIAFRIWRALLESSAPGEPWVEPIRVQIEALAELAGVDYVLPAEGAAPLPGPSAGDVEAAQDLSPAERMEMIRGMVEGLSERLATEGGTAEDWARLIRAYGVLGERGRAAAIWEEAQRVFPDDITRVPILRAARDAGVAQ